MLNDQAVRIAHDWADRASEDEVYAYVYELLEDSNWHSLNRELEAKFGEAIAYGTGAPVSEVTKLLDWDTYEIAELGASLLYEVGREDKARFIESKI